MILALKVAISSLGKEGTMRSKVVLGELATLGRFGDEGVVRRKEGRYARLSSSGCSKCGQSAFDDAAKCDPSC